MRDSAWGGATNGSSGAARKEAPEEATGGRDATQRKQDDVEGEDEGKTGGWEVKEEMVGGRGKETTNQPTA